MIKLSDKESGKLIGEITAAELQILVDAFEGKAARIRTTTSTPAAPTTWKRISKVRRIWSRC